MTVSGGQCVTTAGMSLMVSCSVESWAAVGTCSLCQMHFTDKVLGKCGWITSAARAKSQT